MNLLDLSNETNFTTTNTLPDWMLGAFSRRSISFADGQTDTQTRVFWLQSRGLTIDLRLPTRSDQESYPEPLYDRLDSLTVHTDLEGWYAQTAWQERLLSWHGGASYQLHNRWPEPAELKRIGNCMIEFAPSGAYVEEWRFLNQSGQDALIGLELESETDLTTGLSYNRSGALIVSGEFAGLVLGRRNRDAEEHWIGRNLILSEAVGVASPAQREALLDFQTLIARRDAHGTYQIQHALHPYAQSLRSIELDGFYPTTEPDRLVQRVTINERKLQRYWRIDSLEGQHTYRRETDVNNARARTWHERERKTLDRYTRVIPDE